MRRIRCKFIQLPLVILFVFCCLDVCYSADPGYLFPNEHLVFENFDAKKGFDIQIPYSNKTNHPIAISNVTTSCSCLKAKAFPLSISAGETGCLNFVIDKSRIVDGATYQIIVTLAGASECLLDIKVILAQPLKFEHSYMQWRDNKDLSCHTLKITSLPQFQIQKVEISSSSDRFNCFLLPKGKGRWSLLVSPKPLQAERQTEDQVVLLCTYNGFLKKQMPISLYAKWPEK